MSNNYDVIIVGAGPSGLQAAVDVQKADLTCCILEARDRLGGKVCTTERPDGRGLQELGAAWFDDTNLSGMWAYVEKFGLKTVTQPADGLVGFQDVDGSCESFEYGQMPAVSMMSSGSMDASIC